MSDRTINLSLPYLLPNQAQKHVTLNESLRKLDAVIQLRVDLGDLNEPPSMPVEGQSILVADTPTGVFDGHAGEIAQFCGGIWHFETAQPGWIAWFAESSALKIFDGSQWQAVLTGQIDAQLDRLGLNVAPDPIHRLSLRGESSLFDHNGSDQRIIVNKANTTQTGSLIWQTDYSARAEMGTLGDDQFALKTSDDGTNWATAWRVESGTAISEFNGLRSGSVSVDPDTSVAITPPSAGGFVFIMIISETYPRADYSGIFAYDTGLSPSLISLALGPSASNEGATSLNGTTGPVNSMNIAVASHSLVLENRYPNRKRFSYTFIC